MEEKFTLGPFDEESKILISHIESNFDIEKVEPVYLMAAIAGEIILYDNKKLYLAKNLSISGLGVSVLLPWIQFYDYANIVRFEAVNPACYWDTVLNQANYTHNIIKFKNILFSRIGVSQYDRYCFIGYRITLK